MPRWLQVGTKLRIVAAEACGAVFGPTGTGPRRVVRLPTADSLCDRMERGEEEAIYGPPRCISARPILQTSRPVGFRRAAAENFRPEIFEARATLREQRESAVGRRSANLRSPRWPEDRPARLRHRNPCRSVPVCQESRNVSFWR